MKSTEMRVLLIEDNPGDARIIQEWLKEDPANRIHLSHCTSLDQGLARLDDAEVHLILLDLNLPDSHGIKTLYRVRDQAPDLPIVVLTGFDDEHTAIQAVQSGAQDYLIKDHLNSSLLVRALLYAMERHSLQVQLTRLSMIDELTGLYNRRGFMKLAEHQMDLSRRHQKRLLLLYADVDFLKKLNDQQGHEVGDQMLIQTADLLRKCFRSTDILARIGGDEFAGLAIEFSENSPERLIQRIENQILAVNKNSGFGQPMSLSVGAAIWDPAQPQSIDHLMAQADASMYVQKRERHQCV